MSMPFWCTLTPPVFLRRPGMLASIAESLAGAGLSIESITTELQRHGHSERVDFVVNADCVTAKHMDQEHILHMVSDLESLKETLELDIVDIRVQRLVPNRD